MSTDLLSVLKHHPALPYLKSKKGILVVDDTLGISLLLSTYYKYNQENVLILASNLYNAQRIANLLSSFIGEKNVILFPADELIKAEALAASKELMSNRLYALNLVLNAKHKILVMHPASALRYLPSPRLFCDLSFTLTVNDRVKVDDLIHKLLSSGYTRVNKIDHSLQFAKRGDIIDIFPINLDFPVRISLFDDEIESISYFDIATQLSKEKISIVNIIPASDILFTLNEYKQIRRTLTKQAIDDIANLNEEEGTTLKNKIDQIIEDFEQFNLTNEHYKYYGFLQFQHYSILDYFKADLFIYANYEQFHASYELLNKESQEYLYELKSQGACISHLELFQNPTRTLPDTRVVCCKKYKEKSDEVTFNLRPIVCDGVNNSLLSLINNYAIDHKKVIIALSNLAQKENVVSMLKDEHINFEETVNLNLPVNKIGITIFSLESGFELYDESFVVLTAKELFNYRNQSSSFVAKFKEGTILNSYEDLKPGDYVVHEYNGIGKFIDIKTLEVDGIHRDFLFIEYANNDKLYVPLNQFKLVRKYIGREGIAPKLSNLNSNTWNKTKEKIKNRLNELTKKLRDLYQARVTLPGYAFPPDDFYQEKFNAMFSYTLTPDQAKAYQEIRADMEKPYPMDRLLCGDVGFGKTEVAFRSIFKCINAGKQAALLCPTTLLCRQHYELAKTRFNHFGIKIAVFSRLVPYKEQRHYIKEIKTGAIHLIIGTHRLLSKDIEFHDLGLLVVDEEQRFGVEQKERIKEIKKDVDVLSLSATPIPRTLQMSLVGLRSLSQINTAPKMRNAIQTYVTPYNEGIIKELIERELSRDGQVFYIHNNIHSIFETREKLFNLVPLAKIGVVHGKMERDEIEDVMIQFYQGSINVLIATSIIENGIDVPNVNMIIIENADRFGLSQLYQIKGRVGRSNRIAYAYLLYDAHKLMNEEACKRLTAIQEFAELGSGYKIAQRDLMIRGAGDMLGREQAGFIDSVGIDLYIKLLNEAVNKQQEEVIIEHKPNKLLSLDAYIPDNYIIQSEKVEIYQEIEAAESINALNKIKHKLRDIYGRIPQEVNNLIIKKKVDLIMNNSEFRSIDEFNNKIIIYLSNEFSAKNGIAIKLFDVLYEYMDRVKVSYFKKELRIEIEKRGNWLDDLVAIVESIHKLFN